MQQIIGRGSIQLSESTDKNAYNLGLIIRHNHIEFYRIDAISGPMTLFELVSQLSVDTDATLSGEGCLSFSAWPNTTRDAFYEVRLQVQSLSAEQEEYTFQVSHRGVFAETAQGRFSDLSLTLQYKSGRGLSVLSEGSAKLEIDETRYELQPRWENETGLVFHSEATGRIQVGTIGELQVKKVVAEPFDRWSNLKLLYSFYESSGDCIYDSSRTGEPMTLVARKRILPKGCLAPFQARRLREQQASETIDPNYVNGGIKLDDSYFLEPLGDSSKLMQALRASNALSFELWIKPQKANPYGPAQIFEITGKNNRNWLTVCQGQTGGSNTFITMDVRQGATHKNWNDPFQSPEHSISDELVQIIFTQDETGNACMYINGKLVANRKHEPRICDWEDDFRLIIGRNKNNKDTVSWDGEIQHLSFYDRALSAEEAYRRYHPVLQLDTSFRLHKVPAPLKDFGFDAHLIYNKEKSSIAVRQKVSLDIRPNLGFEAVQMELSREGNQAWAFSSIFDTRIWDSVFPLRGYLPDGPYPEEREGSNDFAFDDGLPDATEPPADIIPVLPGPVEELPSEYLLEIRSEEEGTVLPVEIGLLGTYDFKDVVLKVVREEEGLDWDFSSQQHLGYTAIPSLLPRNTAIDTDFKLIRPVLGLAKQDIFMGGQWLGNQIEVHQKTVQGETCLVASTSFDIPFDLSLPAPVHEFSGLIIGRDIVLEHRILKVGVAMRMSPAGFLAKIRRQFIFQDEKATDHRYSLPDTTFYLPPASRNDLLSQTLAEIGERIEGYFAIQPENHDSERVDSDMVLKLLGMDAENNIPGKFLEKDVVLAVSEREGQLEFSSDIRFNMIFSHNIPAPVHAFSGVRIGRDVVLKEEEMGIQMHFQLQKEGFLGDLKRRFKYPDVDGKSQTLVLVDQRLYEPPHSRNDLLQGILEELDDAIEGLYAEHRREQEITFLDPKDPLALLGIDAEFNLPGRFLEQDITLHAQETEGLMGFSSVVDFDMTFSHTFPAPVHEFSGVRIGRDVRLEDEKMHMVLQFDLQKEGFLGKLFRDFSYRDADGKEQKINLAEHRLYEAPHSRNDLLQDTLAEVTYAIDILYNERLRAKEKTFISPRDPLLLLGMDSENHLPGKFLEQHITLHAVDDTRADATAVGGMKIFRSSLSFDMEFSHSIPAPVHKASGARVGRDIILENKPMHIALGFELLLEGFKGILDRNFDYEGAGKIQNLKMAARTIYEPPRSRNDLLEDILAELTERIESLFETSRSDLEVNFFEPTLPLPLLGQDENGKLTGEYLGEEVDLSTIGSGNDLTLKATLNYLMPFSHIIPAPVHEYTGAQIGSDIQLVNRNMDITLEFSFEGEGFLATLNRNFTYIDEDGAEQTLALAPNYLHDSPADKNVLLVEILDDLTYRIETLFKQHRSLQEKSYLTPPVPLALLGLKGGTVPGKFLGETINLTPDGPHEDARFLSSLTYDMNFSNSIPAPIHEYSGMKIGEDIQLDGKVATFTLSEMKIGPGEFTADLERSFEYKTGAPKKTLDKLQLFEPPTSQNDLLGEMLEELTFQIENLLVANRTGFANDPDSIAIALELLGQDSAGKLQGTYLEKTIELSGGVAGNDWNFGGTITLDLPFKLNLPAVFDEDTGAELSSAKLIDDGEMHITLEAQVEPEDYLGILTNLHFTYTDSFTDLNGNTTTGNRTIQLPDQRLYVPPASQNALLGYLLEFVELNAGALYADQGENQIDYYLKLGSSASSQPQVFLRKQSSASREASLTTKMPALCNESDSLPDFTGAVFSLTQSGASSTLTLDLASKTQAQIKTDYLALLNHISQHIDDEENELILPGGLALLKRRIAERLPMDYDNLLYYHYGWDVGKGCIDLEGGMRLRIDLQNYQFVQPTDLTAERGFVGSGSMHLMVNSYTYPQAGGTTSQLLGFGPFVSQLQTNFQNDIETKGAGGVFELLKTGNRMPYFRLFYPKQPTSTGLGMERVVTIVGTESLGDMISVTNNFNANGSILPGKGSSFFFRGKAMIVPEIQVFVGKIAVYVPVGTTIRQLMEMFDTVPAAGLPGQDLKGFAGLSRPMRILHEGLDSKASYRFINLDLSGSEKAKNGLDALDMPVLKGDRFVI